MKRKKVSKVREPLHKLNKIIILFITIELFFLTFYGLKFYGKKTPEVSQCLQEGRRYSIDEAIVNPQVCDVEISTDADFAKLALASENLGNVQTLYFRKTPNTEIPAEIGNLKNLTSINFHHSIKTSLPPDIGKLKSLKVLSMNKADIKNIPKEIGDLHSLENLTLNNNFAKVVMPPEIAKLRNLKVMAITDTIQVDLPAELSEIKSLEELYLNGSGLSTIPEPIYQLKNLKILNISDNEINPADVEKIRLSLPNTTVVF